jgi:FkbH-like protein
MLVRRDHFLASRINWKPKSANLRSLANELSLGLDAFILIDDDPVECGEVRANCPDVLAIQLPRIRCIKTFSIICGCLIMATTTEDSVERNCIENIFSATRSKRSATLPTSRGAHIRNRYWTGYTAFLERVSILPTGQTNLTLLRFGDLSQNYGTAAGRQEILMVHVRDRFGDYGLVGVIIYQVVRSVIVDTFLLSCRRWGGVSNTEC